MAQRTIIVTGLGEHELYLKELRDQLEEAWGSNDQTNFDVCPTGELNFKHLQKTAAVVLSTRGLRQHESMRYVLSLLEKAEVPVVALSAHAGNPRDPFAFAGHLVHEETTDPCVLCTSLHAIIHSQKEMDRLRRELLISSKQHGGLREQLQKIHEELQLAAMVQKEYLPREIPTLHDVDTAVLWRPASYVSGDIYDVTRLDEDHIGVFLADAVGHGVPAALLTMIICKSLKTKEINEHGYRILPPSEVLGQLNQEMIQRQGRSTRFATAIYAVINCRTRAVQLARAGHPPPLLYSAGAGSRFIEPSGGLLGVFPDEEYEQVEFHMHAGDHMLLYSDGFEQAFPDLHDDSSGKPLPNQKYLEVFNDLQVEDGAACLIENLAGRLDEHSGSLHQYDDLTMLCVHAGMLSQGDTSSRRYEDTEKEVNVSV